MCGFGSQKVALKSLINLVCVIDDRFSIDSVGIRTTLAINA